jgi:FAD/FMN-containing dehydrogenase
MDALQVAVNGGTKTEIDVSHVEELASKLRGTLIKPGDTGYDEARTIWNAMIDRRPALIVQCAGVADVRHAVNFARKHSLLTSVRGGGHNIAGSAICDGGIVIDLSAMRSVRVEPEAQVAHVEPGATLGDVDHETQAFGLATPLGINSTTGVSGLTLGGGFGWLSRKYGLTVDNLSAADIVTADGEFHTIDEQNHPDLFWAIRGGGGNFGIVTRFEYNLHNIGTEVIAGLVVYSGDEATSVLKNYRAYLDTLGEESCVFAVLRKAPPLPFLPETVHGTPIVAIVPFHFGDLQKGEKVIAQAGKLGEVVGDHVGIQPYTSWQKAFDPLLTPGARNYWKSHNFNGLTDDVINVVDRYGTDLPSDHCEIFMGQLGCQVNRVAQDATAYPHRSSDFIINVHGRWEEASQDEKCIKWARDFYKDTAPYATGGVYVNFMTDDEKERVPSAYGHSFDRLRKVKQTYDPDNLFSMNQNISPKK